METQTLRLPEFLDLTAATPLKAELCARRGAPLELNASGVQRIGGLSLQILLAAATAWRMDGHLLQIVDPSAAFTEGLRLMGVSDLTKWAQERSAA
jgi:chemotaxis protein CheX